jgi:hypothetical protein
MDAIRQQKSVVYIYGWVKYKDVFKTDHWTTFCSFPQVIPPSGNRPEIKNWGSCPYGNDVATTG